MFRKYYPVGLVLIPVLLLVASALEWQPMPVADDPLVRMPGTQPNQGVTLESPNRCLNCHADYNSQVEQGFNWKGSMMAHAARDFLFWSCLTVAGQDSIWAAGRPNAIDICERCHFPAGWLEGRSDPPNASAMTGADFDGVHCDFCHSNYDPFFEDTFAGTREGNDWRNYWDETNASGTPSQAAADATYLEDGALAAGIKLFNGSPFYGSDNLPFSPDYTENASGQYFVSPGGEKRASFVDAAARHRMLYSRYHKSKYFCSTCHDVSNPVLANLGADPAQPLPTETQPAYSYFHVERTFSEFMLSGYSQQGGAPGIGPFSPEVFETSYANNYIAKCQDCHMRDVIGEGCNKKGVLIRPNQSAEHPNSGQPLHDLTGGNAWVSYVLASAVPGSPNYDSTNNQLLNQGPAALTLDLTQGEGIDPAALLAGVERAKQQLQLAASIDNLDYNPSNGSLAFRVQNQTGHKLISGFPEGRRMFLNIKAFDGLGNLIYEVNPYDAAAGTLKGLHYNYQDGFGLPLPQPMGPTTEAYVDELVYEMHPTSTLTGEAETFHFALATGRYKDNRIPPKGFRIAEADARLSTPVWKGVVDPNYFTAQEYGGGYDDVSLTIAPGATYVEVNLFYQTTSREYIEFLRDEINGNPANITLPTNMGTPGPGDPNNYVVAQGDVFFSQLSAWGNTIWNLWTHNMDVPGAAPFLMAQATIGVPAEPPTCTAPTPTLLEAVPASGKATLTWTDEHTADPQVAGYRVYYDQSGKSQLRADVGLTTSFADTGLQNGEQYCYKVTSYYNATCESAFSNVLCAIPDAVGQLIATVNNVETGKWVTTGKGKNTTTSFSVTDQFTAGDAVVIRVYVLDTATGLPLANATVEIGISGPEAPLLAPTVTDSQGVAEFGWQTTKPNKRGGGGTTPGAYTATVANVTAEGYTWDGTIKSATFFIE